MWDKKDSVVYVLQQSLVLLIKLTRVQGIKWSKMMRTLKVNNINLFKE